MNKTDLIKGSMVAALFIGGMVAVIVIMSSLNAILLELTEWLH